MKGMNSRLVGVLSVFAATGCAALPEVVDDSEAVGTEQQASDSLGYGVRTTLGLQGGSGGTAFEAPSYYDQWYYGAKLRSGVYVDQLDVEDCWGPYGGWGGSNRGWQACPASTPRIVGIYGRAGSLVDNLGFVCGDGRGTTYDLPAFGGSGGGAFRDVCPSGMSVLKFYGRSGAQLDAIGIKCGYSPTVNKSTADASKIYSWLTWDGCEGAAPSGPSSAAVFYGTDSNRAGVSDWLPYKWKATCGSDEAVTGLSQLPGGAYAHAALCTPQKMGQYYLTPGASTVLAMPNESQRSKHYGDVDWDSGYIKLECGAREYISGVAQSPSGTDAKFAGIRCSDGIVSLTDNSCYTRLVNGPKDDPGGLDWDRYYIKADCGSDLAVGISASPTNGKAHRILCCSSLGYTLN